MRKNLVYLEKGCYFFLSVLKKSFFGLPFSPVFSLTELSLKFEGLNPFFRKPQEYQILLQTSLKRSRPFKTKIHRFHFCATCADAAGYEFLHWLPIHSTQFRHGRPDQRTKLAHSAHQRLPLSLKISQRHFTFSLICTDAIWEFYDSDGSACIHEEILLL